MTEIVLDKETVHVVISCFFRVLDRMEEESDDHVVHFEEDQMIDDVCKELGVWKS